MTTTGSDTDGSATRFFPPSGGIVGLNYFDGRFLRADDLNLERQAQRAYVDLAQRGGGPGVLAGFQLSGLGTPRLRLEAGSAIAPSGGLLYLPGAVTAEVGDVLAGAVGGPSSPSSATATTGFTACAASQDQADGGSGAASAGPTLYLVCLGPARRLCGDAEVFGRVCGGGCSCATDRPYLVDGVMLSLRRIVPDVVPFTLPGTTRPDLHLRSQIASAWFGAERRAVTSLLDAPGLTGDWLAGAAPAAGDDVVPLAVIGWDGTAVRLLDTWTARRERMEDAPRTQWARHLEQRPWSTFMAEVLQFQDQLATAPAGILTGPARILVERGFVELPPAGYLPVDPGRGDLRGQLQDLMGPGVALRLCAVGRDQIGRELESAQHLRRISLLRGIADASALEPVDVLVPDGQVSTAPGPGTIGFAVELALGAGAGAVLRELETSDDTAVFTGAGRVGLGTGLHVRAAVVTAVRQNVKALADVLRLALAPGHSRQEAADRLRAAEFGSVAAPAAQVRAAAEAVRTELLRHRARGARRAVVALAGRSPQVLAAVTELSVDVDPFDLHDGETTEFSAALTLFGPAADPVRLTVRLRGWLRRVQGDAATVDLKLEAIVESRQQGLSAPLDLPGSVTTTLVVHRSADAGGAGLSVSHQDSGVVAALQWSGSPVEADGTLTLGDDEGSTPLATVHAVEDGSIARPGNRYHDTAVDALGVVSGAFPDDPEFVEREYDLLFPDESVLTEEVKATKDWVLFRRRPWTVCEATASHPVVSVPVTVRVLRAQSPDEAARIVTDTRTGTWPDVGRWRQVDVAFGDASARLLTPPQTWRTAYSASGGLALVAFGGYAGRAGAPAATVGLGRLSALVEALAPTASSGPGFTRAFVDAPAAIGPAPTADGVALFVTYDPQEAPPLPRIAVQAIVADGTEDPRTQKIRDGDPSVLAPALPALGEGSAATIRTADVAVQARTLIVEAGVGPGRTLETVLWVHAAESQDVRAAVAALAGTVVAALAKEVELKGLTLGPTKVVAYDRGTAGPAARLFLVITPQAPG